MKSVFSRSFILSNEVVEISEDGKDVRLHGRQFT